MKEHVFYAALVLNEVSYCSVKTIVTFYIYFDKLKPFGFAGFLYIMKGAKLFKSMLTSQKNLKLKYVITSNTQ